MDRMLFSKGAEEVAPDSNLGGTERSSAFHHAVMAVVACVLYGPCHQYAATNDRPGRLEREAVRARNAERNEWMLEETIRKSREPLTIPPLRIAEPPLDAPPPPPPQPKWRPLTHGDWA